MFLRRLFYTCICHKFPPTYIVWCFIQMEGLPWAYNKNMRWIKNLNHDNGCASDMGAGQGRSHGGRDRPWKTLEANLHPRSSFSNDAQVPTRRTGSFLQSFSGDNFLSLGQRGRIWICSWFQKRSRSSGKKGTWGEKQGQGFSGLFEVLLIYR